VDTIADVQRCAGNCFGTHDARIQAHRQRMESDSLAFVA